MKFNTINEKEIFAINPELTVKIEMAGDYQVAIIDNIYKNPEMVRELMFQVPPTESFHIKGAHPGPRIHIILDQRGLAPVFLSVSKKMFDYAKDWTLKSAEECFAQTGFIANIMHNDRMEIRVPHQDAPYDSLIDEILEHPTEMRAAANGMAGLIYLNTPEECAGGTRLFKYKGSMITPVPEEDYDYDLDHNITDTEGDWEVVKDLHMKWNRLVIYPAYLFHTPWMTPDMGFEGELYRINQVIFA